MSRSRPRILVAEDDAAIRLNLGLTLQEFGCVVVAEAETTEQTIALAGSSNPDLCLIDIVLAEASSGIDAAEVIIERFGTPVILMSGLTDPPYVIPFLRKPFSEQQLLDALRLVLDPSLAGPGRRGADAIGVGLFGKSA